LDDCIVIRFYELADKDSIAEFEFYREVKDAWFVDVNENKIPSKEIKINKNTLTVPTEALGVSTIIVKL
jgi:alpha-mannosidase